MNLEAVALAPPQSIPSASPSWPQHDRTAPYFSVSSRQSAFTSARNW
jgi:hypothetical protein